MTDLNNSRASLRFFSEDLDPDELTRILGVPPTDCYKKGQVRISSTGHRIPHRRGMWQFGVSNRSPGDLDAQIQELLEALPSDLEVWSRLASEHDIDLFFGLFMEEENEGISLEPESLKALSDRGIRVDFDIYAPRREDTTPGSAPSEA